jgi:hypothetical protein
MVSAVVLAPETPTDLQIEQWVQEQYGFVPHPYWISHCKELYIQGTESPDRLPWHRCPPDKRAAIREAFLHLGMLKP